MPYRIRSPHARPSSPLLPPDIPRLIPITITDSAVCEIVLVDGRRLRFPETLPSETLRAFLAAMEAT